MGFDAHANFAYSTVLTAPSPATSGTSLVVQSGDGAKFPTPVPFNATVWPTGVAPTTTNAEIVRVTAISTDTFTIVRAQEGSTARTIVAGDQIAATVTSKTVTDAETQRGIFGDGSDGAGSISTNTTITKNTYYTTLHVSSGAKLTTQGFMVYCQGTLTIDSTCTIDMAGLNTAQSGAAGGGGGSTSNSGYFNILNSNGGTGATGNGGNSNAGTLSVGVRGGNGGAGGTGTAGTAGTVTAPTARQGTPIRQLPWAMFGVWQTAQSSSNSIATASTAGGGGGGDGTHKGGGGGGPGQYGVLVAASIVNNGTILNAGGDGGAGDPAGNTGGGGGGGGGVTILVTGNYSGTGTNNVNGGAGGAAGGTGSAGSAGSTGVSVTLNP